MVVVKAKEQKIQYSELSDGDSGMKQRGVVPIRGAWQSGEILFFLFD